MALNPALPVVNPGDLITSAHLNNIRTNLVNLDSGKVARAGDTMTGSLQVGGHPASATGALVDPVGTLSANYGGTVGTPSLFLVRAGAAIGTGGVFAAFRTPTTLIGSITVATASSVAYNTTSDGRLKDDLGPIDDPLDVIGRLRPRRLRWKADGVEFDGFIAQDVAEVVPGAVTGDPDGDADTDPLQLDVSRLVPYLVAALQELAAEVELLHERLDDAS